MNILHIIPSLDCNGAAAQLGILTKRRAGDRRLRICSLAGDGVGAARLRACGQHVDCLGWTRAFDPVAWRRLRRLLKSSAPDLIHVWGLPALRALAAADRSRLPRTLVSSPLPAAQQVNRLDRWLLRRVRLAAAWSHAEAAALKQLGLNDRQVTIVPPGVEAAPVIPRGRDSGRDILCVGPLEPRKGFRDALWALDILRYVFDDATLTFVGAGPQRAYLEWFAGRLQITKRVRFLGARDDVPQLLARGCVAWTPAAGGRQAVLEAMAAGCPVVVADHPMMRELATDGQSGYLIPPGDKVALCKRTRALFLDEELARRMGEAARRHVLAHFDAGLCAERWSAQYRAAADAAAAA